MCGIYGIFAKNGGGLHAGDVDIAWKMGILTQLRGMISSGMFATKFGDPARVIKCLGPSNDLGLQRGWDTFEKYVTKKAEVIVGHGRQPTIGEVKLKNAHPFNEGHITLVHNGTVSNMEHEGAEVDSHAMCMKMAKNGVVETLKELQGAYAVIVHDAAANKLYISRNAERPLHYFETNGRIYVMSDKLALEYLLFNTKIHISYPTIHTFFTKDIYVYDFINNTMKKEGEPEKKPSSTGSSHQVGQSTSVLPSTPWPNWRSRRAPSTNLAAIIPINTTEKAKEEDNHLKEGDTVTFTCTGYQPDIKTGEYVYFCRDDDQRLIVFRSSRLLKDVVQRTGVATINKVFQLDEKKGYIYQVKTRGILWEDGAQPTPILQLTSPGGYDLATTEEEPEDEELAEQVETAHGQFIPRKVWENLVTNGECKRCNDAVYIKDHEQTLVWPTNGKWNMVCGHCVAECMRQYGTDDINKARTLCQ
jgi:hypothetical protein